MWETFRTMTHPEAIYRLLVKFAPEAVCDDCISRGADIHPRQQVNPIASALGLTNDFERKRGTCSVCKSEKLVTRSLRAERRRSEDEA